LTYASDPGPHIAAIIRDLCVVFLTALVEFIDLDVLIPPVLVLEFGCVVDAWLVEFAKTDLLNAAVVFVLNAKL
jgi:hypothetical protein